MSTGLRRVAMPPITQPDMRPVGRRVYRLFQPWSYTWHAPTDQVFRMRIEQGVETDGASVPSILWSLTGILPDGLHRPAALVHDIMYRRQGEVPLDVLSRSCMEGRSWPQWLERDWTQIQTEWSRRDADRLFARILRELEVRRIDRRLMYRGVRIGGWWGWYVSPVIRRWRGKR